MRFELVIDGNVVESFDTLEAALEYAADRDIVNPITECIINDTVGKVSYNAEDLV